jgi:competence protein ComFC
MNRGKTNTWSLNPTHDSRIPHCGTIALLNRMNATVSNWLEAGLALMYPPVCQICDEERALPKEGYVCAGCRSQVKFIEPPFCERCGLPYDGEITTPFECANCRDQKLYFRFARSAARAAGTMLEVIHRYKYQRALWFEPFLAEVFVQKAAPELALRKWDLIVPVPLFPTKEREREFNQAERLARCLGRATGIRMNEELLRRVEPTSTQTLLTREQRARNVRRAFSMSKGQKLAGQSVILVDDVLTTGATTSACARVLRKAGATDVCVWTVARGL